MKYKFKTPPYDHQLEGLKFLLRREEGGALLCEPRTGKTKIAIDYFSAMHQLGKINRVLIFSPVGVMSVWEEEISTHCPVPYRILVWDRKNRKDTQLPKFGQDILDIVIVNYDAASSPGLMRTITRGPRKGEKVRSRKGGRFGFRDKVKVWDPQLIILDESHRIKSSSARKSVIIHELGKYADYRIIMTGTVVTKKKRIYDVYSQWKFLNPSRFTRAEDNQPMVLADFKDHYSITTKRNGFPQWLKNRNEDELHRLIHEDAFSIRREDCFDLPPLTHQVIPVPLEESSEAYDQMAEDMIARIRTGEITEASIALVQGLRLRQLAEGIAKTAPTKERPEGRLVVIGREKLQALEDRLEDLMEAGEHVIIGAAFRPGIKRIQDLCDKRGWANWTVQGGVSNADRALARKSFEAAEEGAIFIGQPAAASEGIDLRSAAITIWYSLPLSWVHFKQYSDRNALHEGPKFAEFLLTPGMDQMLYQNLLEDGDVGKKFITNPEMLRRERG